MEQVKKEPIRPGLELVDPPLLGQDAGEFVARAIGDAHAEEVDGPRDADEERAFSARRSARGWISDVDSMAPSWDACGSAAAPCGSQDVAAPGVGSAR